LTRAPTSPFRFSVPWFLAYIAVVAFVLGGLFYGRAKALATYGTLAAQADWNQWRDDVRKDAKTSASVERRVPKSAEPPALVLMRDYFLVCLVGAVLLTSVLFATFMVLIRGALAPSPPTSDL
jgi:hypothetical protein